MQRKGGSLVLLCFLLRDSWIDSVTVTWCIVLVQIWFLFKVVSDRWFNVMDWSTFWHKTCSKTEIHEDRADLMHKLQRKLTMLYWTSQPRISWYSRRHATPGNFYSWSSLSTTNSGSMELASCRWDTIPYYCTSCHFPTVCSEQGTMKEQWRNNDNERTMKEQWTQFCRCIQIYIYSNPRSRVKGPSTAMIQTAWTSPKKIQET
jgi:hypothetical protein